VTTVDTTAVRSGVVATYDDAAGYGEISEGREGGHGARWWFHCTAIADGSRAIEVGAAVQFRLTPGHLGRYEAIDIRPGNSPRTRPELGRFGVAGP
jgi:cold shock CspA family protein